MFCRSTTTWRSGVGGGGGGGFVRPLRAAESKGQENVYFEWGKNDFLSSPIFKILRKMAGNPINNLFKKYNLS